MMFLLFLSGLILGFAIHSGLTSSARDSKLNYWRTRAELAERDMLQTSSRYQELRRDFESYIIALRKRMTDFKEQQETLFPNNPEPRMSYLRGIYNGIELVHSSVEEREAQYK